MNMSVEQLSESVDRLLAGLFITSKIIKLGDSCPPFCEDQGKPGIGIFPRKTHIHGKHYRLELQRAASNEKQHGPFTQMDFIAVGFWDCYRNAELEVLGCECYRKHHGYVKFCGRHKPRAVQNIDILACAQLTDPGSFEEFASEYGYDSDSIKAESIWKACSAQYREFCKMFNPEELDGLIALVSQL